MKDLLKRNTSIGLWLFIFVLAISLEFLNGAFLDSNLFSGNYSIIFLSFFAGYLVIENVKKNKRNTKSDPATKAWGYAIFLVKRIFPVFLGGVILAFFVQIIVNQIPLSNIVDYFIVNFDNFIGVSHILNQPLAIISEVLICSLLFSYVLVKSEDFFKGFFAPALIVLIHLILINQVVLSDTSLYYVLIISSSMLLGILSYYIVLKIKKKKLSENQTLVVSFAHVLLVVFILYTLITGVIGGFIFNELLYYMFFIILIYNKDYIGVLYNKSDVCNFLGRFSIYYYIFFAPIITLMVYIFPDMNYVASIIFSIVFCSCWSFIIMVVDELLIVPLLNKKDKFEV